ncbi:MAG: hypothetical protein J5842_06190, partial [Lachnospiraceae bacterium]|nr:hypothetical protein [Lachnospiraceae bacterium]
MKQLKRLCALLLSLAMVVGLMPVDMLSIRAYAADDPVYGWEELYTTDDNDKICVLRYDKTVYRGDVGLVDHTDLTGFNVRLYKFPKGTDVSTLTDASVGEDVTYEFYDNPGTMRLETTTDVINFNYDTWTDTAGNDLASFYVSYYFLKDPVEDYHFYVSGIDDSLGGTVTDVDFDLKIKFADPGQFPTLTDQERNILAARSDDMVVTYPLAIPYFEYTDTLSDYFKSKGYNRWDLWYYEDYDETIVLQKGRLNDDGTDYIWDDVDTFDRNSNDTYNINVENQPSYYRFVSSFSYDGTLLVDKLESDVYTISPEDYRPVGFYRQDDYSGLNYYRQLVTDYVADDEIEVWKNDWTKGVIITADPTADTKNYNVTYQWSKAYSNGYGGVPADNEFEDVAGAKASGTYTGGVLSLNTGDLTPNGGRDYIWFRLTMSAVSKEGKAEENPTYKATYT